MAYYRREEHAYITIGNDMKTNSMPGVVLLCGKESFLVDFYLQAIKKRYVDIAYEALDYVEFSNENASFSSIRDAIETISLMSERKVVAVPSFVNKKGKFAGYFANSGEVQKLIEYLPLIPDKALFVITAEEPEDNRDKTLAKLASEVRKYGKVYDFEPLHGKQLTGFIGKRFRNAGKFVSQDVLKAIASESGYENRNIDYGLYNLNNDIRKIISYSGKDSNITAEDIKKIFVNNPERDVFAMLDAIGKGQKGEALVKINDMIDAGTNTYQLLSLIIGQLELMTGVREMMDRGMTTPQIQADMKKYDGLSEYRVKKSIGTVVRHDAKHLKSMLVNAYEIDEMIKTGEMKSNMALEYFVARI